MIERLATLRYVRFFAALVSLTPVTPIALAAQGEPDTVVVHSIYAGDPLLKLVTGLASLAKGAFRPEDAELIQRQAWEESSSQPEVRNGQVERGYGYRVEGRSQRRAVLAIFLRSNRSYIYDVRIEVADDGLMKAIRAHLAKLAIDSLVPIDDLRLTLAEERRPGMPPRLVVALHTVKQFGCVGNYIDHDLSRAGFDTLRLTLHGVSAADVCPGMPGPATMSRELAIRPGKYLLEVSYRRRRDRLVLQLSDSMTSVTALDSSLVEADERPRWRHPPNSFVFHCGVMQRAKALCADAQAWVARQPGIFRVSFSPGAVNPYHPQPEGPPDDGIGFFRYDRVPSFEALRPCFDGIDNAIREAVGVSVTVEDWQGATITAHSRRSFHERHIEVPARVSGTPACPSLGPR